MIGESSGLSKYAGLSAEGVEKATTALSLPEGSSSDVQQSPGRSSSSLLVVVECERSGPSRSSVVTLKRKTPRIDPWETPPLTGLGADQLCPTLTVIVRWDKKVASSSIIGVDAPLRAKASKHLWKLSLLKALA